MVRSELLGQCVQRAASGTLEDRENIQSLHQALQALQQDNAHNQSRLASLSSEHERTMTLLAEFEVGMKGKRAETWQKTISLEERLESFLAAQAGLRGDLEGLVGESAGEQRQLLVSMLEKQATTLEQTAAKQLSSEERIEQLKQSLDVANAEAARVRAKYEDDLRTTRWVVDRVTRLEVLVDQLRSKDAAIQKELEIDPEQGIRRAAEGNDADSVVPPVERHVLSPENPGYHDEGYEDEWWGEHRAKEYTGLDGVERGYFQWDALGNGAPPGLGPCARPPPLPESMKKASPGGEVKIPQPSFKLLKDAPKLDLSAGGEPWEVGMTVHQWRVETRTVLTAIHPSFAEYFDKIYDQGRQRYEAKRLTGLEEQVPEVLVSEAEMETRLSLALLKNLPLAVRQPVVEGSMSKNVRCILMLESLHERYAPGGREELESIQRYMRQLPAAQDFKGAMMTLRRWKLAKQRAQSLGLPEQAPNEGIAALDGLMRSLEKKHQQLGMRINILRMQPDVVIPTSTGLDRYVSLLEVECRRLAADQEIRDARAVQSSEVVVAAEAEAKAAAAGLLGVDMGPRASTVRAIAMAAREVSSNHERHRDESDPEQSSLSSAGSVHSTGTTDLEESDQSENRPPLWYLVLHPVEYAVWRESTTQLMTHSIASFEQVNGPNLIANGVWGILEELDFQLPLEDIRIGQDQYIIEARQTWCIYQDGIIRPVVLVHLIDVESGREQMLALTECDIQPRTQTWTLDEAPGVPPPPGYPSSASEVPKAKVALASGDTVDAWRTRDGELMIGDEELDQNADWILSVRRLRGIRGAFLWDELGPRVLYFAGDTTVTVHCFEQNGLPYISWEDFKPIRVMLARDWKSKGNAQVMKIEDRALRILDYMPTLEAVESAKAQEESAAAPAELLADPGESRAEELCSKSRVTFDEVWSAVQLASLVERRSDRSKQVAGEVVRQHHPDLEFLSVSIAVNLVFRPHRDRNSLERESVVLGLTRFQGGQLWVEGVPGENGNNVLRCVNNEGEIKAGKLHELSHKSVRFNAAVRMHGTEPFQGVRGVAVGYTPRGGDVQGMKTEVQNFQDFWDVGVQGLGRAMAFEAIAEEVIDLTIPPERPGHTLKVSKGVLSIDIAGPYAAAYDGTKYALVAVFRIDDNLQLHFMRPMKRRLWSELFSALQSILAQVSAICGERPQVVRIHSDKAREFLAQRVIEGINALGVFKTTTTGYDPQANGLAERTVGLLKERARGFLIRGNVHKKFWPLMMAEAARRQRDGALHRPHQGKLPEPGDCVAVTVQDAGPFDPRVEQGRFIAQSDVAVQGALVLVTRAGQEQLIITRLPAVIDKKPEQWKTHVTPLGDLVWVSSSGEIRDGEMVRDPGVDLGMLTVEEREQGHHVEQGLPFVARATALEEEIQTAFEEEPQNVAPKAQRKTTPKPDDKLDRYKILPYEVEQEMNRAEVKVAQLVTDTIDARVLSDPKTPADEKWKWVNEGLRPELETLQAKEIYDEWDEADLPPGAKVLPAKVVLTKKPLQDDAEVDPADPLSAWRAKARIVVCGNYEQNTVGHDPDNASANPAIEHIRWSAACLASNPGWTGLVLDITAAFLNAKMDNDTTFVRPPKVCRNEELDGKTFEGAEGVMFYLDPVSSGVWAIRKQGEPESFHGTFDMYVDDGLLVGPVMLCQALAEVLLKIWQMKIQGFLPSEELKVGTTVQVGDKKVPVRQELQFLGMVIKRTEEGVALHQHPWIETELERRGWTMVRGAANLPEVVEGQTEPAPRDDAYAADLHRAQSEVGSLFWVGLRTRPDLLATVGALSCMSTVDPRKTYKLATQVWRYLAGTRDKVLFFKAGGDLQEAKLSVFGDASLAPGASRSRTGVVVKFGGHVLAYRTQRQSLTAFSAFEAEVEAAATAYQLGTQVKTFLDKFLQKGVETELFGDNSACVSNLTKGSEYVQPTRTRHFGMRCS
ncbi:unnamed protein product, partial [Symbiodinium necroappetens]